MKLEPKWKCHECRTIHDDEDSAHECCQPEVSEGYLCPECRVWHETESKALDCCGHTEDEDAPPPRPSTAELEAAGQLRLLP